MFGRLSQGSKLLQEFKIFKAEFIYFYCKLQKQKEKCIHEPLPEGKCILERLIPWQICQIWLSMTWIVIPFNSMITVTIPEECLWLSGMLCMYSTNLEVPEVSEVFVSLKWWHKPFRKQFCVMNWGLESGS